MGWKDRVSILRSERQLQINKINNKRVLEMAHTHTPPECPPRLHPASWASKNSTWKVRNPTSARWRGRSFLKIRYLHGKKCQKRYEEAAWSSRDHFGNGIGMAKKWSSRNQRNVPPWVNSPSMISCYQLCATQESQGTRKWFKNRQIASNCQI